MSSTPTRVLAPEAGDAVRLGGLGVRFMIDGAATRPAESMSIRSR